LKPLLTGTHLPPARRRSATEVRDDLIRAGATMTVSLDEVRRQLEAAAAEEV